MRINLFLLIFNFWVISGFCSSIHAIAIDIIPESITDTIIVDKDLYNGRIWRDLYVSIKEDQFLFSNEFLPGQITMNGKTFNTTKLRYDILNDELMTVTDKGHILQLNKEMVENFTLTYRLRIYYFTKSEPDTLNKESGYFNVLYKGRSSLYIRYFKEISKRGPGKNYEDFVQAEKVYIIKDGIFHQVRNNRDFKKILSDKKNEIKAYLKENRILISGKSPDTYVPVLEYYDTLK
jgi:hypothetical protein